MVHPNFPPFPRHHTLQLIFLPRKNNDRLITAIHPFPLTSIIQSLLVHYQSVIHLLLKLATTPSFVTKRKKKTKIKFLVHCQIFYVQLYLYLFYWWWNLHFFEDKPFFIIEIFLSLDDCSGNLFEKYGSLYIDLFHWESFMLETVFSLIDDNLNQW